MDINDVRGLAAVIVLFAFIGVCWWAFSPRRKKRFDDAANLPFADDEQHENTQASNSTASESTSPPSKNMTRD